MEPSCPFEYKLSKCPARFLFLHQVATNAHRCTVFRTKCETESGIFRFPTSGNATTESNARGGCATRLQYVLSTSNKQSCTGIKGDKAGLARTGYVQIPPFATPETNVGIIIAWTVIKLLLYPRCRMSLLPSCGPHSRTSCMFSRRRLLVSGVSGRASALAGDSCCRARSRTPSPNSWPRGEANGGAGFVRMGGSCSPSRRPGRFASRWCSEMMEPVLDAD